MISPYKYNHGTGRQRRALLGCNTTRLDTVDWLPTDRACKFTAEYPDHSACLYKQLVEGTTQQRKSQTRQSKYWQGRDLRNLPCNKYMYQFGQKTYLHTMLNRFAYTLTNTNSVVQ